MSDRRRLDIEIRSLLDKADSLLSTTEEADAAALIRQRLDEPLRVAIAGRVKAGKSTLLNALIGERLAPTDAGECTKVVTWYRHGIGYDVTATLDDGRQRPMAFTREHDRLIIDTRDVDTKRIDRLDVAWPSARLQRFTIIDTPGLEAHDEDSAARTRRLLGIGDDEHSDVDAVVYLMRHVHRLDVEFLEAFTDRSLTYPSPVNAIAVLSRADEIGAGRPDALDSATMIAARHAADSRIRSLCATVVPVAGLIAETGRTLSESEGGTLRALAQLPESETERMVMSVDRFTDPARSPIDSGIRQDLLLRLGIFGVRLGIERLRTPGATTSDLTRNLVHVSGVEHLASLLDRHFGSRAAFLKGRSAIANLKAVVHGLEPSDKRARLMADVERLEAAAPELSELRLLHLAISGSADLDEEEIEEVDRLVTDDTPGFRLGMPDHADPEELELVILERLDRWRRRAAFPLASPERKEACELVATTYERLHAEVVSH